MPKAKAKRVSLSDISATAKKLREQCLIRAKADSTLTVLLRRYEAALSIEHEKYLAGLRAILEKQLRDAQKAPKVAA